MTKLFIDDIRRPYDSSWHLAISYDEAIEFLKHNHNVVSEISFDHDLGMDPNSDQVAYTGMDVAWWLVDAHTDGVISLQNLTRVIVHSANPIGAANIAGLLDCYRRSCVSQLNNLTYEIEVNPII